MALDCILYWTLILSSFVTLTRCKSIPFDFSAVPSYESLETKNLTTSENRRHCHPFPSQVMAREGIFNDILDWHAPREIAEKFPYYLVGFNNDGIPVWIIPWGIWKIKEALEMGPRETAVLAKYCMQMIYRWYSCYQQSDEKNLDDDDDDRGGKSKATVTGKRDIAFIIIADLEGYDNRQLLHMPTLNGTLEMFRLFYQLDKEQGPGLVAGLGINSNFVSATLWRILRPMLGELTSRIETFGSGPKAKAKWRAVLLQDIPPNSLPPQYGGYENHTNVMESY